MAARVAPLQAVSSPSTHLSADKAESFLSLDVFELALLLVALMFGGLAYGSDESLIPIANYALPLLLIAAMAWGNFRVARNNVVYFLTPMFMIRVGIIFYFGFGSIVPLISNDDALNYLDSFYIYTDVDLLKYNLVNVVFATVLTLTIPLWNILTRTVIRRDPRRIFTLQPSNLSLRVIALSFLVVGGAARYFIILPFQFGFVRGTFPSAVAQIALAENIGLFLYLLWALRARSNNLPVIVGYAVFTILMGLLTFSKTEVILPMVMVAAAMIYHRPTTARFVAAAAVIVLAYNALQPIATHGRAALVECCGGIDAAASPAERARIILQYYEGDRMVIDDGVNYAAIRLSYAGTGTFVINEYDAGYRGESLDNWYAVFIPRFLWRDKPNLTQFSIDLNERITGNDRSAVATGFPAEGYWNAGWLGVAVMALVIGTICWFWTIYSMQAQLEGCWHLFIVVLLGVRMGMRVDGFFIVDIMGPLIFALFGHFAVSMLNRFLIKAGDS